MIKFFNHLIFNYLQTILYYKQKRIIHFYLNLIHLMNTINLGSPEISSDDNSRPVINLLYRRIH